MKKLVFFIGLIAIFVSCSNPKLTMGNIYEAASIESNNALCSDKYAQVAHQEGLFRAELILKALSKSQEIHKQTFVDLIENENNKFVAQPNGECDLDSTVVNIYRLLANSQYEFYNLYPEFVEVAQQEGARKVVKGFKIVMDATFNHINIIQTVIDSLQKNIVDTCLLDCWHVCSTCGNLIEGDVKPKEKCANCSAKSFLIYKL